MRSMTAKTIGATMTALGSSLFIVAVPALGASEASAPPQPAVAAGEEAGFVVVDGTNLDDIPPDTLHVGCTFTIDFYNFAEDVGAATVRFRMLPPTESVGLSVAGNTSPDLGEDPAGGPGDLDASETYTLTFDGDPDPETGAYHVRLFVNAPGAVSSDQEYRPFWVSCEEETTTTTTSTTSTTTTTTTSTTSTTTVPTTSITTTTTVPTTTVPSSTSPTTSTPPTSTIPSSTGPTTSGPPTDFDAGLPGPPGSTSGDSGGVISHSPFALAGVIGGLAMAVSGLVVLSRRRIDAD